MKNTTTRILILAILAACLIGCGCAGSVSATDNETSSTDDENDTETSITLIEITGITAPEYGKTPTTSGISTTANVDISSPEWKTGGSTVSGTFEYGKEYTLELTVTAKDGYTIASGASCSANTDGTASLSGNKITITFDAISKPDDEDIYLTISGITKPTAGSTPVTSKPTIATTSTDIVTDISTITWKEGETALSGNFGYGKTYTAVFTATIDSSIQIGTITINKPSDATSVSHSPNGNVITISIIYPATAAETTTTTSTPSVTTFSANTTEGTNPLTVKFTYTLTNTTSPTITLINAATNGVLESPTSNTEVTHTFTPAGTYLVRLKVDDGSNTVYSSNNITIKVNAPATKTAISSVAVSGITAPVANANPSPNCTTGAATYTATITWYKKGSSSAMSTSDKFESNTQYTVKAVLTPATNYFFNTSLSNTSAKINNNVPTEFKRDSDTSVTMSYTFPATAKLSGPSITFSVDPAKPKIPSNANTVKVTYTYTITGNPTSATLYFGEGTEVDLGSAGSDGKITGTKTHEFSNIGTFTAYISARNANDVSQQNIVIPVGQEILASIIEAGPLTGTAPLAVTVNDKSTGTITTRTWNFGDGSVSSGEKSTSHTYEKPGTYTITLTVSDGKDSDMASKTITVTEKKTDDDEEEITNSTVNYEPFITLGDIGIPSPMDLIAEFVRLFQCMINFDNYTLFSFDNSTKEEEEDEEEE